MKTVLYSVSTGYFARNLLRTGVIEKLLESRDTRIVIVTPGFDDPDFVKEFTFDQRIHIERMYDVRRDYDWADVLIWKSWLLGHRLSIFQKIYKSLLEAQLYWRYFRRFHNIYGKIFDKYAPDLVVGGSPGVNSRRDIPIFVEAKRRSIPTLALIHSWDNIAKRKGPMWCRPDMLGVWNDFQRDEAVNINFYDKDDVILLGPPHFDLYWKKDIFLRREDFFNSLGLDPAKKLITFVATAPGLVKNFYIMDILIEALKDNKFVLPAQIVCRPTPSIDPKRNANEFGRYEGIKGVVLDHQVQYSRSLGWNPDRRQLLHFANLVGHTDVQVSIVSTATIESAIVDKPIVNVGFSNIEPEIFNKLIIESVFSNHFKAVIDCQASYVAKDPRDIITGINRYLLDPALDRQNRKKLTEEVVYQADGKATERITRLIIDLLYNKQKS